ncbi:MAG: LysM peptidoglycan-binding domain-containing protein [Lewinellaceae bacterium]|nr:LysM peptidoglycan-binding domain-containing protein [Lewinellaceae bacterium]MCB9288990.1 LysM peptidoglycan-binding domain-containing protein [Lewinellaceae bacterium]
MFSKTVSPLLFLLFFSLATQAQEDDRLRYIDQFKEIAIREMERAGIPASIKLAQAILESNSGKSDLARRANNHFGIKCGNDWNGKTFYKKDDDYNEEGKLVESCFRSYKNPEMSFIAHSEFLRDPAKQYRYGFLFRLDPTDYKAWAEGLRRAGYATSANYSLKLIDIIERYQLNFYDSLTTAEVIAGEDVINEGEDAVVRPGLEFENNDVRYVLAKAGETPNELAIRTATRLSSILDYNEGLSSRNQQLAEGTVIYLQPKRNSFRGKRKWHYVKEGETMYEISQMYGIKLDRLYNRNKLPANTQPAVNERIKIRGCKVSSRPKMRSEVTPVAPVNEGPIIEVPDENEDGEIDFEGEVDLPEKEPGEVKQPAPPVKEQPPVKEPPVTQPTPTPTPPVKPDEGFGEKEPVTPAPAPPAVIYHTVQKGDTLYNISRRYDTTVEGIKSLNGLTSNLISLGQRLRVK